MNNLIRWSNNIFIIYNIFLLSYNLGSEEQW